MSRKNLTVQFSDLSELALSVDMLKAEAQVNAWWLSAIRLHDRFEFELTPDGHLLLRVATTKESKSEIPNSDE